MPGVAIPARARTYRSVPAAPVTDRRGPQRTGGIAPIDRDERFHSEGLSHSRFEPSAKPPRVRQQQDTVDPLGGLSGPSWSTVIPIPCATPDGVRITVGG